MMIGLGHAEISSAEMSSVRVLQTTYSRTFDAFETRPNGFGRVSLRSWRKPQDMGRYRLESSLEFRRERTQGGTTPLNWRVYTQRCLVAAEVVGGDEVDRTNRMQSVLP